MRQILYAIVFLALIHSSSRADDRLQSGDGLAMCGDSITEQALYTVFIEDYLLMCQPAPKLHSCQFGWGGETARAFLGRMENDVLWFKPSAITICYGMNDGGYKPIDPATLKNYHDSQKGIIAQLKKANVRLIVLGSPGCVDADTFKKSAEQAEMYNKTLARLRDVAHDLAKDENVVFADVYQVMAIAMLKAKAKYGNEYAFCGNDGVHPGPNGHLAMAYAFLKALGCDGDIGTITFDMSANKADATAGHKVLSAANGVVSIESSRYPFCFSGEPKQQTTRSAVEFIPFNEDLNRLMLIVKGAAADKLNITWGAESKEFTKAQLEKGINLAAEFLDHNPFAEQFEKVEKVIHDQQRFEIALDSRIMRATVPMRQLIPEEGASLDNVIAAGARHQKKLSDASINAVVPIKHEIKVEEVK